MENEDRSKGVLKRIDVSEVLNSRERGKKDHAFVIPARVAKQVPVWVFDYLGVTPDEPEIEWLTLEDESTGERVVVLIKGEKKKKKKE